MPEVPIPKKPVTTLRRCEAELAAQERRIAELEADLSTTREVIGRLERIAGLVRADEERRARERRDHVQEELFNYSLAHPQQEDE